MANPKVVNCHHFKNEVQGLPPNTVYVGRGFNSKYGNPYSTKSGKYLSGECVGLHRVHLYKTMIEDPKYFSQIKEDLWGKDLACWCKQTLWFKPCHADNYIHVLSDEFIHRTYDKSVISYLMDDLRTALDKLSEKIMSGSDDEWLRLYMTYSDTRLEISYDVLRAKDSGRDMYDICVFVAHVVVDIESALSETDPKTMEYRLLHALWRAQYFFDNDQDRRYEPIHPRHKDSLKIPKTKGTVS